MPNARVALGSVAIRWEEVEDPDAFPFCVPAVVVITELDLDAPVTYLVGENGSGKSTLLEALAISAGLNPEGGTRNLVSRPGGPSRACTRR